MRSRTHRKKEIDPSFLVPFEESIFNRPVKLVLDDIEVDFDWVRWTAVQGVKQVPIVDEDDQQAMASSVAATTAQITAARAQISELQRELAKKEQQLQTALRIGAMAQEDMRRLEERIDQAQRQGRRIEVDLSVPFVNANQQSRTSQGVGYSGYR